MGHHRISRRARAHVAAKLPAVRGIARWFGVEGRITRLDYLVCGLLLAIVKYAVEAGMLWLVAARFFYPWDFVNPVMSVRTEMAQGCPLGCRVSCFCGRCRSCGSRCR